jgi:hypothetical protein
LIAIMQAEEKTSAFYFFFTEPLDRSPISGYFLIRMIIVLIECGPEGKVQRAGCQAEGGVVYEENHSSQSFAAGPG